MLKAVEFIDFLNEGSSKCFVALCNDKKKWVIRMKKKNKNSKRLFSEYLAGILALKFGINHPKVQLVEVENEVIEKLKSTENIFELSCKLGVATKFIKKLRKLSPPLNINSNEFPKANFKYLKEFFPNKNQIAQLYGMKVLSEWIVLKDFHKYENLLIDENKKNYFLDFDLAFMSSDSNDWSLPDNYDWIKMSSHQAPF